MGLPARELIVAAALGLALPAIAAQPDSQTPGGVLVDQAHQLRMQGAELANQRYEQAVEQMRADVSTALQRAAAAEMSLKATQSYWKRWCGPVPGCAVPLK